MMEYKGYLGLVEYDDEAGIFHGEVVNLRDMITFQGETVQELRRAFQESVDDYLAFCAERGEEPERPYSGTFTVRIPPVLHRDIAFQARMQNKSLNSWVAELLEEALTERTPVSFRGQEGGRAREPHRGPLSPHTAHTIKAEKQIAKQP
jgi:predicted HicB family RNase H-like nuclease